MGFLSRIMLPTYCGHDENSPVCSTDTWVLAPQPQGYKRMGCQRNISVLHQAEDARDMGIPMGELVSKRLLGALGMLMPSGDYNLQDYNDARKPVSNLSHH